MTILDRLLAHDAWTTRQLLLRSRELSDEQLDRTFDIDTGSLRATFEHIISTMEHHTDTLLGRTAPEATRDDQSVNGMLARLTAVAKDLAACASSVEREGREDDFVANLKTGARRSFGGVIAHVITHSMHHRAHALFIMERLGMLNLIEGDVLGWEAQARGWGWDDGGSTGSMVAG